VRLAKQVERYGHEDFDPAELASIVQVACEARNGWKVILARCSPERRSRPQSRDQVLSGGES